MARLRPVDLSCEYCQNPTAVDTPRPRLSWKLASDQRGAFQTHYRLLAASSPGLLAEGTADLWDTGFVASEESLHVPYGGAALAPWQTAWWMVQVVDDRSGLSDWSEAACWSAGPEGDEAWEMAVWIQGKDERVHPATLELGDGLWKDGATGREALCLRKTFVVEDLAAVESAILQAHSNYWSLLSINGVHVGQAVVWGHISHYDARPFLREGENVLTLMAGGNGPGAYVTAALEMRLAGGRVQRVATDTSWKCRVGNGPDWQMLGYDDSSWGAPDVVQPRAECTWRSRRAMPSYLPPAQLRRGFRVESPVTRARLAICGLGYHEAFLNGERVGDHRLDPAQTDYDKRCLYVVHDVTALVREGENALGVIVADGFFNQEQTWGGMSYGRPKAKAVLRVEHADGSVESIATDASWRAGTGPVVHSHVYSGEEFDARLEDPSWCTASFDESGYAPVEVVDGPGGVLAAQMLPPIRAIEVRQPVKLTFPADGVAVFDCGQNLAGVARLKVRGQRGERLRLRFAEAIAPDGNADFDSTGIFATNFIQEDTYVCKGEGLEVWEPRFTYHGFQHVELVGWSVKPTLESLEVVVLHTDARPAGEFHCSDPLLERIHETAKWTMRSNMHSIPTDCPARERCGWLGDAHVDAEMTLYNFDAAGFLSKYLRDIETASNAAGLPPMVAPGQRRCGDAVTDWGCALPMVCWYLYLYHGDLDAAAEHLPAMTRWIHHLDSLAKDGIVENGLGDWCYPSEAGPDDIDIHNAPPGQIPLTSTAYYYHNLRITAELNRLLGRARAAEVLATRAAFVREKFIEKFYDASRATFGSQTVDSMALFLGLVPDGEADKVAESLAADVRQRGNHFTTGIHGLRHLFWALSEHGQSAAALDCLRADGYPGFKHLFSLGGTTIWERWGEGWVKHRDQPFYSMNHPMQAGFDAWFYNGLAGIAPSEEDPGFKRVILKPHFVEGLEHASAWHDSARGRIESAWRRVDGAIEWSIKLPANTTGLVFIPAASSADVTEGGIVADSAQDVELLLVEDGMAIYQVGSGSYRFVAPEPVAVGAP